METLLLSYEDVLSIVSMKDVIETVEEGYVAFDQGQVLQPDVVSMEVDKHNGETDIKACYNAGNEIVSVKVASGFWDNVKNYQISTMQGTVLLIDGRNGLPVCIMDGALITNYRTGAAGAISAKYLAKKNAKSLGVIGAGGQARMQVMAMKEVLPIETVKVFSPVEAELKPYKDYIESKLQIEVILCSSPEEAVKEVDIAISTTPATQYWVGKNAIAKGTHIVAVGADMPGKNEWDPELFRKAKVVTDSSPQCVSRGETRNALVKGIMTEEAIYGEVGEIIGGLKAGRENDEEITIFDTTGMAIQDNVTAVKIYEVAKSLGYGTSFDFKSR